MGGIHALRRWRSLGGLSTWLVALTIATSRSWANKNHTPKRINKPRRAAQECGHRSDGEHTTDGHELSRF